jgi:Fic family protein
MKKRNGKLAVLSALNKTGTAVDLPTLLQELGEDFAARTVRRWLQEMEGDGLVQKSGKKRGTRYQIAPPQAQSTTQTSEERGSWAQSFGNLEAIGRVRRPIFQRDPVSYNLEWLNDYQPNLSAYLSAADLDKLKHEGQRSTNLEPAGTYAKRIYNRLLIDLSFNSSRLEGNTYSLLDTERLIIDGAEADGKLDEEKIMILNHKDAIRRLVDNSDKIRIEENEIFTLHFLLSEGLVPREYAGRVRDHGVRIGGSTYIPLEGRSKLERQVQTICCKAEQINNPHEQSLFLLAHIGYLQAFCDVNKRTSRLCANIPLIRNNLVPLSFNDVEKDDYASAMIAIYELNDIRPLAELYRHSYLRTCKQYDATAEVVGIDEILVRYRHQRRELIRDIITRPLADSEMQSAIQEYAEKNITATDQTDFVDDVYEDLNLIGPQRIAGMGITREQLNDWQAIITKEI